MLRKKIIAATYFSFLLLSCRHQAEILPDPGNGGGSGGGGGNGGGGSAACDPNTVYFQQQVLPILLSNCAMSGCHDVATHEEGVILTTYQYVMATGDISPGNPFSSDLYKAITDTDPDKRMPPPPRAPLTTTQIALIRNWILQGARDLSCSSMCDSTVFTFSGSVRNIITNKCQGCHQGSAAASSGGVDLSSYANVKTYVTNGKLWGAVNHNAGFSPMPKNAPKLSACELSQIRKWIDAGALNN